MVSVGPNICEIFNISENDPDRKLIIVYMSLFSVSRNANVAYILVCGGCGSHFQNGRHDFSMSHILANNGDSNLMLIGVNIYVFRVKEAKYDTYNMPVTGCVFKMAATLIGVAITSMQNNDMFLFVVSEVLYSYEAPHAITLNTII